MDRPGQQTFGNGHFYGCVIRGSAALYFIQKNAFSVLPGFRRISVKAAFRLHPLYSDFTNSGEIMSHTKTNYTYRASPEEFASIDAKMKRYGFATRAKFLSHAAAEYGQHTQDDVFAQLSHMAYSLHQLERADTGRLHLLKPRQIKTMSRHVREAMTALIQGAG